MNRVATLLPLRPSPVFLKGSPEVVRVLDRIRFEVEKHDSMAEFAWFAREYPRVYRHHIGHVEHRLASIYDRYECAYRFFEEQMSIVDTDCFSLSRSNSETLKVYWDFEALLNAIGATLDVLARIVGVSFKEHTPPSFSKLCKKNLGGSVDILLAAQKRWVSRMKDYRDCFVHYTCVDTMLTFSCNGYSDGFELRCKLPTNPNIRDIIGFRFSRRVEVLRYAIATYKNLMALDKAVAQQIDKDYRAGVFPQRTTNLFCVGNRMHT